MSVAITPPKFKLAFLGPKFWPVWISMSLLYIVTWLPFPVIRVLGRGAGVLLGALAKSRVKVARKNISLCFPNLSQAEQDKLVKANLYRAGMGLFETAMGWWWPDWRVRKHGEVEGLEHAKAVLAQHHHPSIGHHRHSQRRPWVAKFDGGAPPGLRNCA